MASNVLTDLINQNVFIDSEVLMYDLEKEFKYFIPTETFEQALTILQEKRKILLYGAPGVGKTSNSKMLMLYFIKMGYRIRYSSNSENIADLKKALTTNKQGKEIIFLDDCLGQHYFNLKNGQSQELLDLIKHVNLYPNKILILNSRVTILNEAQQKLKDLEVYLNREEFSLKLIDMNQVSLIEKAKIFYTFLQRNEVDNNFYNSLRTGKKYRDIVNHKNYNPRIIEFVTLNYRIKNIPFENYYDFIMQNLNQPKDVWQDEFEVKIKKIDRIFMYTLYSLTDTVIEKDVLRKCFDKVINRNEQIDFTINHFDGVLKRLNRSMIRIIDSNNIMKIGVLNPSINDYMYEIFKNNETYRQIIKENAIYLNQIEKACELSEFKEFLKRIESTGTLSSYQTLHKVELIEIKWLIILEFNIVREKYRADVPELLDLRYLIGIGKYKETSVRFFKKLLNDEELADFYQMDCFFAKSDILIELLGGLDFENILDLLGDIVKYLDGTPIENPENLEAFLLEEMELYILEYSYSDYCDLELDIYDNVQFIKNDIKDTIESSIDNIAIESIRNILLDNFYIEESFVEEQVTEFYKEYRHSLNTSKFKGNFDEITIDNILNRPVNY